MFTPIAANVAGTHVERQLIDVLTAPDQSAFGVGLSDITKLGLQRRARTLAVPGAGLRYPRARPADSSPQVSPSGMDRVLQVQINDRSYKEGRSGFLPLTLGNAKKFRGGARAENLYGIYSPGEAAQKTREGQDVCVRSKIMPLKSKTSSEDVGNAKDGMDLMLENNEKKEVEEELQKPSGRQVE